MKWTAERLSGLVCVMIGLILLTSTDVQSFCFQGVSRFQCLNSRPSVINKLAHKYSPSSHRTHTDNVELPAVLDDKYAMGGDAETTVTLEELRTGMKFHGEVVSVTPYAAFIDINAVRKGKGGVPTRIVGFLHNSDMQQSSPPLNQQNKKSSVKGGTDVISKTTGALGSLLQGDPIDVYVKDVFKNAGRFTLSCDPHISKEKLVKMHHMRKEEGSNRRKLRRFNRIIRETHVGDFVQGMVHSFTEDGIVVKIESNSNANMPIWGVLTYEDLPFEYRLPADMSVEFKQQLLSESFTPDKTILSCSVAEILVQQSVSLRNKQDDANHYRKRSTSNCQSSSRSRNSQSSSIKTAGDMNRPAVLLLFESFEGTERPLQRKALSSSAEEEEQEEEQEEEADSGLQFQQLSDSQNGDSVLEKEEEKLIDIEDLVDTTSADGKERLTVWQKWLTESETPSAKMLQEIDDLIVHDNNNNNNSIDDDEDDEDHDDSATIYSGEDEDEDSIHNNGDEEEEIHSSNSRVLVDTTTKSSRSSGSGAIISGSGSGTGKLMTRNARRSTKLKATAAENSISSPPPPASEMKIARQVFSKLLNMGNSNSNSNSNSSRAERSALSGGGAVEEWERREERLSIASVREWDELRNLVTTKRLSENRINELLKRALGHSHTSTSISTTASPAATTCASTGTSIGTNRALSRGDSGMMYSDNSSLDFGAFVQFVCLLKGDLQPKRDENSASPGEQQAVTVTAEKEKEKKEDTAENYMIDTSDLLKEERDAANKILFKQLLKKKGDTTSLDKSARLSVSVLKKCDRIVELQSKNILTGEVLEILLDDVGVKAGTGTTPSTPTTTTTTTGAAASSTKSSARHVNIGEMTEKQFVDLMWMIDQFENLSTEATMK